MTESQIISDYANGKFDVDELERRLDLVPVDEAPSLALVPAQHTRVVMSSVERTGPWIVPPQLSARVLCGNLIVDLREARLDAGGTTIEVDVTMGNVEVIVPPGVMVEVGASSFLGNVEDHTDHGRAAGPIVRITGRVKLGNLELSTRRAGETRRDARRRRRAERRAWRRWRRALPRWIDD